MLVNFCVKELNFFWWFWRSKIWWKRHGHAFVAKNFTEKQGLFQLKLKSKFESKSCKFSCDNCRKIGKAPKHKRFPRRKNWRKGVCGCSYTRKRKKNWVFSSAKTCNNCYQYPLPTSQPRNLRPSASFLGNKSVTCPNCFFSRHSGRKKCATERLPRTTSPSPEVKLSQPCLKYQGWKHTQTTQQMLGTRTKQKRDVWTQKSKTFATFSIRGGDPSKGLIEPQPLGAFSIFFGQLIQIDKMFLLLQRPSAWWDCLWPTLPLHDAQFPSIGSRTLQQTSPLLSFLAVWSK